MGIQNSMKLSVIVPARNEEASIAKTVSAITQVLSRDGIDHEVDVVDDGSGDRTAEIVMGLAEGDERARYVASGHRNGYGFAGLTHYTGDAVAIMMAGGSDNPQDLVAYYRVESIIVASQARIGTGRPLASRALRCMRTGPAAPRPSWVRRSSTSLTLCESRIVRHAGWGVVESIGSLRSDAGLGPRGPSTRRAGGAT
jgi:hypothetical protein